MVLLLACGSHSASAPPTVVATAPEVPTGLTATPGDQQVALAWTASPGATTYAIKRSSTSGGPYVQVATVSVTSFIDVNVTNGSSYFYVVTALAGAAESQASKEVAAAPSASTTPPADNPAANLAGLGTWFCNDWDGASAFVDVFKQSRPWQNAAWNATAPTDALGWPTSDASTVLMTGSPTQVNGTYKLVFTGQAKVALMWTGGTVANQQYDAASNTTTADVTFNLSATGSLGLVFTNTQRTATSAVGSGFTQARLYRPGYPADGSVVFTTPFLDAFRAAGVRVVRMMDWGGGSSDVVQHWADRATPASATQGGLPTPAYTAPDGKVYATSSLGVALEHRIQLCNALQTDFWINIPPVADQDFILRTAQALRYGTDGLNPYASPQASPVFPPLASNLKVYVEYANETWNSAAGFDTFAIDQAICAHLPAGHPLLTPPTTSIYTLMWRWPAYNIANISTLFRTVFGDAAMMTRVRPVLEAQQGDGQDTLGTAILWLDAYGAALPTPEKVSDFIYGGGGSAYYGVINSLSADPDTFFAASNYPDPQTLKAWTVDSLWTYNEGVKHVAYEGGPGLSFSDADNRILNADPRMTTLVRAMHDAWSAAGGDLAVYYCVEGPSPWEFTHDITVSGTPKLNALASIMASPRAAVTAGSLLPGTLVVTDPTLTTISWGGSGYSTTLGGKTCNVTPKGMAVVYPGHTAAAVAGTLTLSGGAGSDAQVEVWINGVRQGTVTLAAQTGAAALETSTALPVNLPAGLCTVRLVGLTDTISVYSITVQ